MHKVFFGYIQGVILIYGPARAPVAGFDMGAHYMVNNTIAYGAGGLFMGYYGSSLL